MLSPANKRIWGHMLPFGLIWLVTGWVFLLSEAAVTGNFENQPDTAIRVTFPVFLMASLAVFVFGLLTGWVEIRFLSRLFRRQRFVLRIIFKLLAYSLIFHLIILISFPIAAGIELGQPIFSAEVWSKFAAYLASVTHLSTMVQLSFSLLLSLFYFEISDYIGPKALSHFLTGKYHQPVVEERVFMFLDMRSSTSIAERLGHSRYFAMLRKYYEDLSAPILRSAGEVYQYAGDEVIVSWPLNKGVKDQTCLHCFFWMKEALGRKQDFYQNLYGEVPAFKAGIHCGKVTAGEIGIIKKEILFTGDVLNTCARIQGLCNSYGADLLISADLLQLLKPSGEFKVISKGFNDLRGKDEAMELFSVQK
ncbi:adenylate/guanylate cyclase domain-containing protein [Algoriphagus aestuariicola]|uniref:Adenylate/guanylate cyclase domain-containing protein n=1 Tax=Algoriphagus aestuariicola TaxID=1852016 RepID=A0ABS3BKA9_9BACT|nr:adenylate/guanylate cyclase domain-containing protein [Algoriphagus aestuariicola]MBN7799712.1 adenylate/guanylate cyclase domain-containing protein [Algoriphagus aestuariicola]